MTSCLASQLLNQYNQLLINQDCIIAKALHEFRTLGRLVTRHSRYDDAAFFQAVLTEGSQYLAPHQTRDLWKTIKKGRLGNDPLRMVTLDQADWNPHFEALEAGCVVSPEQLIQEATCHHTQDRDRQPPTMADLPTLSSWSMHCGLTRSAEQPAMTHCRYHHNAAALAEHAFPLMLKMWGEEPIQYKGSPMALIPKIPQPVEVKHFRGILLLPTLAKSFHSLIRKRIIRLLDRQRMPGQLGGFAGQEVLFGSQALRILGRTVSACQGPQHGCALCGFEHGISLPDQRDGCNHLRNSNISAGPDHCAQPSSYLGSITELYVNCGRRVQAALLHCIWGHLH